MELKLIDDNGQSSASVSAPDTLFAREYNEALGASGGNGLSG